MQIRSVNVIAGIYVVTMLVVLGLVWIVVRGGA